MKCACYVCGIEVEESIQEHFTSKDGRILCDKCSEGIEPCSNEVKRILSMINKEVRSMNVIRRKICENTILELEGNQKNIDVLNKIFVDTNLTLEEERSLIWLSTWEKSTIKSIISAFSKVKYRKIEG
ncbi:hypothetical protein [Clostridium sp. YIM B02506]|uniref:hypothetical protein n=1 Tax=Clostridium sp. YIM B02506 TaxID=2910680 RepID=UPI001EEDE62B|nr:hypothetical protein [Clostridium sp. YIM B02506]